jgi:hypothetical protein
VYLGFPDIPFINFNHIILPKHEAATKLGEMSPTNMEDTLISKLFLIYLALAKLGPLSSQKNYTTTMVRKRTTP